MALISRRPDARGPLILLPEMNLEDLSKTTAHAGSIPNLLKKLHSADWEEFWYENVNFCLDRYDSNLLSTQGTIDKAFLPHSGETFTVKNWPEVKKSSVWQEGHMLPGAVGNATFARVSTMLNSLLSVLDEYATEVEGKHTNRIIKHVFGCHVCGAVKCPDGKNLRMCSRCKSAHYCCVEHQKEDWPNHKLNCKPCDK